MSSFLVNCAPTYHHHHGSLMHNQGMIVDPAFPPAEEYSQNNYMTPDFFNNHHHQPHQYDGYFRQTPNIENPYMNHTPHTVPPHNTSLNYGNYAPPSNNAYQLPQHIPPPPHHPTQQDIHELHVGLHNLNIPPEAAQQPPTAILHPSPQNQQCMNPQNPVMMPTSSPSVSPCQLQSPPLSNHIKEIHSHSADGSAESEPDDLEDDDYSHSGLTDHDGSPGVNDRTDSPEKIIYPWMKKVHVAGYGEYLNYYFGDGCLYAANVSVYIYNNRDECSATSTR